MAVVAPDRTPLGRPAIPIDIAAFAYHWSDLKITRRTLFFSGLARESAFLALVDRDATSFAATSFATVSFATVFFARAFFAATPFAVPFEGTFFAIGITRLIPTAMYLSSDSSVVTEGSGPAKSKNAHPGHAITPWVMTGFVRSSTIAPGPALS